MVVSRLIPGVRWFLLSIALLASGLTRAAPIELITGPVGEIADVVESDGNLYFTTNERFDVGAIRNRMTVWRVSKTGAPGSERAIYTETSTLADEKSIGVLTWTQGRDYYAIFAVKRVAAGVLSTEIKRVPLAGAMTAVTIATLPNVTVTAIDANGTYVTWVDSTTAIKTIPLDGGAILVSVPAPTRTPGISPPPVRGLSTRTGLFFYARGNNVYNGSQRILTTPDTITSLIVDTSGGYYFNVAGDESGAIRGIAFPYSWIIDYQLSVPGMRIVSQDMHLAVAKNAWAQCQDSAPSCTIFKSRGAGVPTAVSTSNGTRKVFIDATHVFWDASNRLYRHAH